MNSQIQILHLVIHTSEVEKYERMYNSLAVFYKKFKNIKTIFIEYSQAIDQQFEFRGDKLLIRGSESMVPGLLWKTIDSMLIMRTDLNKYKYVVRSNVSTLINFNRLENLLSCTPNVNYLAGNLMKLEWLDVASGIIDKTWFGTLFAQGTLICMSSRFVNELLLKRHKLRNNIIDDVSLGIFYKENFSNPVFHHLASSEFVTIENKELDDQMLNTIEQQNKPIVWRNKSINRELDVINLNKIGKFVTQTILLETNSLAQG